jgi:hypothetical protein
VQHLAGETEPLSPKEDAPMEQVTLEESEAHEESLEEQEGSSSKNGDEEGAQQGGD